MRWHGTLYSVLNVEVEVEVDVDVDVNVDVECGLDGTFLFLFFSSVLDDMI